MDWHKLWNHLKWKRTGTDIGKLFDNRADAFTKHTAKILVNMEDAMDGIHEYMGFKKAFEEGALLEWREIALLGKDDESMILMVGALIYPPGSTVELRTGEKVEISANTSEYFQRLVRIGLPLKYAGASKQEVMDYLKQADEENEKDLEEMKETVNEMLSEKNEEPVVDKNAMTTEDFDLSQLTEEQRQQLTMPSKTKQ